jgi:hypothetical protein
LISPRLSLSHTPVISLSPRQFIAWQIIRQPLINNSIPVQGIELRKCFEEQRRRPPNINGSSAEERRTRLNLSQATRSLIVRIVE